MEHPTYSKYNIVDINTQDRNKSCCLLYSRMIKMYVGRFIYSPQAISRPTLLEHLVHRDTGLLPDCVRRDSTLSTTTA